jgi:hypothetical protein
MAAKLYDWGDGKGKIHTISKAQHDANVKAQRDAKTRVAPPPLGYYDPNLDAQEGAESRAYANTIDDAIARGQDLDFDLGLARNQYDISKGRTKEDYDTGVASVERSAGRSLSDLLTSRARTGEDYQTTLADLQRNYDRLANTQGEQTRKAGAEATGGAYAQSARKRAANQALDKSPIDLAYNRFVQDSSTSETRLGEDKALSLADLLRGYTRSGEDLDAGLGQTGLNYTRVTRDLGKTVTRAGDEHSAFGLDIGNARQLQWGGQAVTGAGTPVGSPTPVAKGVSTIGAGPGFPNSRKKKKKGRVVTYSNSVGGP